MNQVILPKLARVSICTHVQSLRRPGRGIRVFQFLEQAHRLAFGYGIQTWELNDGMRSLLLPYLFGRLFAGVAFLGGGPRAYLLAAHLLLAAVSRAGPKEICLASRPGSCSAIALPPLLQQQRLGEFLGQRGPAP